MKFKLKNGSIVDRIALADAFPNHQIPEDLSAADAAFLDIEFVHETAPPAVSAVEIAVDDGIERIGGVLRTKWRIEPRPAAECAQIIAALKRAKNDAINAWRSAANASTFPHLGHLISCDALSRGDIESVATTIAITGTFPPNFPNVWKTADNAYIPMDTIEKFKAMYANMAGQGVVNFNLSEAMKAALGSASTVADIDSIMLPG